MRPWLATMAVAFFTVSSVLAATDPALATADMLIAVSQ